MNNIVGKSASKLLLILIVTLLTACGGGGGGSNKDNKSTPKVDGPVIPATFEKGQFIDSAVQGLRYVSVSSSGETDEQGIFEYIEGEEVSFYIGNLFLGKTTGTSIVTPLTLTNASSTRDPRVVNILRLLQTLDDNNDPEDGIVITQVVQDQFTQDLALNWAGDIFTDNTIITAILSDVKPDAIIVSAENAMAHFEEQLSIGTGVELYSLSGTASGLIGNVELELNDDERITVTPSELSFQFDTRFISQASYTVTIETAAGAQTCVLQNSAGNITNADVSGISLVCPEIVSASEYQIGGSVTGLTGSVTLRNNSTAEELVITENGLFTFFDLQATGTFYTAAILENPDNQTCIFTPASSASGEVAEQDITSISLVCADNVTPRFFVSGSISGLDAQQTVSLSLNGNPAISFTGAEFSFAEGLLNQQAYSVNVVSKPSYYSCVSEEAQGTIISADISNINIVCLHDTFNVGGSVAGHLGQVTISYTDNDTDTRQVNVTQEQSDFIFEDVLDGTSYTINAVIDQSTGQTCQVINAASSLNGSNISNVNVTCSNLPTYAIGGTVNGLTGTLLLRNNGVDDLSVSSNGEFEFTAQLGQGENYALEIINQPANQVCSFADGGDSGSVQTSNITSIAITCTDIISHALTTTISGLAANASLDMTINGVTTSRTNGSVLQSVLDNTEVSIATNNVPAGYSCSVAAYTSPIITAQTVAFNCSQNSYQVTGTVEGLQGTDQVSIVLAGQAAQIYSALNNTLNISLAHGNSLAVSSDDSLKYSCAIQGGNIPSVTATINNLVVLCDAPVYTVSGSVAQHTSTVTVTYDDQYGEPTSQQVLAGTTDFEFTGIFNGADYQITSSIDASTNQSCPGSNTSGMVNNLNISNVSFGCTSNPTYSIGGQISGLARGSVTLVNTFDGNETDLKAFSEAGVFNMNRALFIGQSYSFAVQDSPLTQTCSVRSGGQGTVSGLVESVQIECIDFDQYTITTNVQGLENGDTINVSINSATAQAQGNGSLTTALYAGQSYELAITGVPDMYTCAPLTSSIASVTQDEPVTIACSIKEFEVSGAVTGLLGADAVALTFNGQAPTSYSNNQTFSFKLPYNSNFSVSDSSDKYDCEIDGGDRQNIQAPQVNISVVCSANDLEVSGSVTGLGADSISLTFSGQSAASYGDNDAFSFQVPYGSDFSVSDDSAKYDCEIDDGDLQNIEIPTQGVTVSCAVNNVSVSGTVTGLGEDNVSLSFSGQPVSSYNDNAAFSFLVPYGSDFLINIVEQPAARTCLFAGNVNEVSGTNAIGNVENLNLSCAADRYDLAYLINTVEFEGATASFTSLIQQGEFLGIDLLGNTEELTVSNGVLANDVSYDAVGLALSVTTMPEALECEFDASEGTTLTLPMSVDKSNATSSIYDLSVAINCVEKAQHNLTVQLQGLSQQVAPVAEVQLIFGAEDQHILDYQNLSHSRQYYEGTSVGFSLSENINGYDCGVSQLLIGSGAPSVFEPPVNATPALVITGDASYIVDCKGQDVALNLVVKGAERDFEVAYQVDGEQRNSAVLTPFGGGITSLMSLGAEPAGSSLSNFVFSRVPIGSYGCFLEDQDGITEGGELNGTLPLTGANLIANCVTSDTVARAASDPNLISDPFLRNCLANSGLDQNARWEDITELSCPYDYENSSNIECVGEGSAEVCSIRATCGEEGNDQICSLEGIKIFSNLESVNFDYQGVTNIEPLLSLNKVEFVYFTNAPLSDFDINRIKYIDSLAEAVINSGNGSVPGAGAFLDVIYDVTLTIEDDKVFILEGQNLEVLVNASSSGCIDISSTNYPGTDVACNGNTPLLLSGDPAGLGDSGSYTLNFKVEVGGNKFQEIEDLSLDVDVEVLPFDSNKTLSDLFFADADLKSCLESNYGGLALIDIRDVDLTLCGFSESDSVDLQGLQGVANIRSLTVGDFSLQNQSVLAELLFIETYSAPEVPTFDTAWRSSISDSNLLACIDSKIASDSSIDYLSDITSLTCSADIADAYGIDVLTNLAALTLSNGSNITSGATKLLNLPLLRSFSGYIQKTTRYDDYKEVYGSNFDPVVINVELEIEGRLDPYFRVTSSNTSEVMSFDYQIYDRTRGRYIKNEPHYSKYYLIDSVDVAAGSYAVIISPFSNPYSKGYRLALDIYKTYETINLPKLSGDLETDSDSGTVTDGQSLSDRNIWSFWLKTKVSHTTIVMYQGDGEPKSVDFSAKLTKDGCGDFTSCYEWDLYLTEPGNTNGSRVRGDGSQNNRLSSVDIGNPDDPSDQGDISVELYGASSLPEGTHTYKIRFQVTAYDSGFSGDSGNTDRLDTLYEDIDVQVIVIDPKLSDFSGEMSPSLYQCLSSEYGEAASVYSIRNFEIQNCGLSSNDSLDLTGLSLLPALEEIELLYYGFKLNNIEELDKLNGSVQIFEQDVRFDLSVDELSGFMLDPRLVDCVLDNAAQAGAAENRDITNLNCSGYGIYDLTGLDYFTELQQIDLSDNWLDDGDVESYRDLYELSRSSNLDYLDLSRNKLSVSRIQHIRTYWGLTSFLPSSDLPLAPSIEVELTPNVLQVFWSGGFGADKFDLSVKINDEDYFITYADVVSGFSIDTGVSVSSYELLLKSTNDVGSIVTNTSL